MRPMPFICVLCASVSFALSCLPVAVQQRPLELFKSASHDRTRPKENGCTGKPLKGKRKPRKNGASCCH